MFEIGSTCEPHPDLDPVGMTNCTVSSRPVVIGVTERRARARLQRWIGRFFPAVDQAQRLQSCTHLLSLTDLDTAGIKYDLPEHVRSDMSTPW